MNNPRLALLSKAFNAHITELGGKKLNRLTVGRINNFAVLGNEYFSDSLSQESAGHTTAMDSLFEIIYGLSLPWDDFCEQCNDPKAFRASARHMAGDMDLEVIEEFAEKFGKVSDAMDAATVKVNPEKGESSGKPEGVEPSPIGSPPSSIPSEEQETPSESTGSSGSSPSSEPSNTSMPLTPQATAEQSGPTPIWEKEKPAEEAFNQDNVTPLPPSP